MPDMECFERPVSEQENILDKTVGMKRASPMEEDNTQYSDVDVIRTKIARPSILKVAKRCENGSISIVESDCCCASIKAAREKEERNSLVSFTSTNERNECTDDGIGRNYRNNVGNALRESLQSANNRVCPTHLEYSNETTEDSVQNAPGDLLVLDYELRTSTVSSAPFQFYGNPRTEADVRAYEVTDRRSESNLQRQKREDFYSRSADDENESSVDCDVICIGDGREKITPFPTADWKAQTYTKTPRRPIAYTRRKNGSKFSLLAHADKYDSSSDTEPEDAEPDINFRRYKERRREMMKIAEMERQKNDDTSFSLEPYKNVVSSNVTNTTQEQPEHLDGPVNESISREPSEEVIILPSNSYSSGNFSNRSINSQLQSFYNERNLISNHSMNHQMIYPMPESVDIPSSSSTLLNNSNSNNSSAHSGEDCYNNEGGGYGGVQKTSLKRCQNRGASTRYRLKKRAEYTALQQKESELKGRNMELRDVVDDLSIKIKYLKSCLTTVMQGCKAQETK